MKPNLEEIKARCEAATEGPWLPYHDAGLHCITDSKSDGKYKFSNRICEYTYRYGEEQNHKDIDFIAHARQDIPDLLKYIEELESELEQVKDSHRRQGQLNDVLSDKLKKAVKVIEFYSDSSNYSLVDEGRNYQSDYKCYELHTETFEDLTLGTRARKFLEENK